MSTEYFSIKWMNKDNHHKTQIKTMLDRSKLVDWAVATLENHANVDLMIITSTEPTKHTDHEDPSLKYWAEPITDLIRRDPEIKIYCITCQQDGYPETKGFDDWFNSFEGADDIAYRLSQGEYFDDNIF